MKRFTAILLAILLLGALCACGKSNEPSASAPASEAPQSGSQPAQAETPSAGTQSEPQAPASGRLGSTYQVPLEEIYIDVPGAPYNEIERGFTMLYTVGGDYGVGFTAVLITDGITDLDSAFVACRERYTQAANNKMRALDFTLTESADVTVNGIAMRRFNGVIKAELGMTAEETKDLYTYGYVFIMNGIPCSVEGTVYAPNQQQDMIDEINAVVEDMIRTVRDHA